MLYCIEGQISSSTQKGEIPTENNQSSFGCIGNSYTKDFGDGTIAVFIDDDYYRFEKIDE